MLRHASRSIIVIALFLLSFQTSRGDDWKGANWIWDGKGESSNNIRHFRRSFELKTKPTKADIHITADNNYTVFVNGQKIGADGSWNSVEKYDMAPALKVGTNVVAIEGRNGGGPAGLIARLSLLLAKNQSLILGTDKSWKVSQVAPDNWKTAAFDDKSWQTAVVLGNASTGPWNIDGTAQTSDSNVSNSKITGYRPASEEIEQFILPEGFKIELVASEPDVINPVCVTLDEKGRMYISESHTYRYGPGRSPVKEPSNPIVRLDPQPDGSFKRIVVADGFEDPVMGMVIRDGKLWCTANNFLFTFDLNEDGTTENKKTLLTDKNKAWNPFGMFVLEWGPAGEMMLSVGNHNIDIGPPEQEKGKGVTGRGSSGIIARMNPDGTNIERLVHGLRVPYSFDYDPFGQLWLLSNGQGNPNRFVRVIEGVDYHCYSRGVSNEWLAGRHPLAPPCLELPRGACTQLLRYYGSAFPKEYQGSLFLDNWGAHGFAASNRTIHRYVPDDRNNIVAKEDFLTCRDPHFRCSHVLYAQDGNLLIADWYGRDDESDLTGRIWKVSYDGPDKPQVQHPILPPEQWRNAVDPVNALSSPSHLIREKAMDALVKRGDKVVVGYLADRAEGSKEPVAAASALWTLIRIGSPHSLSAVSDGRLHPDWRIRRMTIDLMRRFKIEGIEKVALQLSGDTDPAVHVAAARALPSADQQKSQLIAALIGGAAEDEHLRYEAAWHLADVADEASFEQLLSSQDENVRLAGFIALDVAGYENRKSSEAAMAVLAKRLAAPAEGDAKMLLELAKLHRSEKLVAALRKLVTSTEVAPEVTASALLLLRSFSGGKTQALDRQSVDRFLAAVESGKTQLRSREEIVVLFELLEVAGPSDFALDSIRKHIGNNDAVIRDKAIGLAVKFGTKSAPVADAFWNRILDARLKVKPADKLLYLTALLSIEQTANKENWTKVLQLGEPLVVTDAVRSWRHFGKQSSMAKILTTAADGLVKRQPELKMDIAAVIASWNSTSPPRATDDAFGKSATPSAVESANVSLGRKVFQRSGCVKCHTTVSQNTERAPSLKGIGKAQKLEYLVESVLKPSKVIKTGFETETIITVNGKSHTGLVKEQGNELRVITPDSEVKVPKKDVEQRTVDKLSLMPVGQHRGLSLREFADLIAYLKSLK